MESHLLQMRGLKQISHRIKSLGTIVASFTDAWIETAIIGSTCIFPSVASFTDAWIETISINT